MRRLTNTVIGLQQAMPQPVSHYDPHPVHNEDKEDWPDPPPWPDTADCEELAAPPTMDRLDKLMAEL